MYRYTIPGSREPGLSEPMYSIKTNGYVDSVVYNPTSVVIIQSEATPHYHKDSVNVTVEEVDAEELGIDVDVEEETESDDTEQEESDE